MGFPRQEYWSGLPCPPPGDLSDAGTERHLLRLLHWQAGSLPLVPCGKLRGDGRWRCNAAASPFCPSVVQGTMEEDAAQRQSQSSDPSLTGPVGGGGACTCGAWPGLQVTETPS